jgi:RhtB (resistance to homoserine/threonine) family protein
MIIALLAGMSPGPDFFLVMKNSLGYGRRVGIASALGIAAALAIHASYTIVGLALILRNHHLILVAVQLLGAAYLAYLGLRTLISTFSAVKTELKNEPIPVGKKSVAEGFLNGFLCNLLNPKAFVFFLSIFSQFIAPDMPKWVECAYGAEVVLVIGAWFILLASLISSDAFRTAYKRFERWFERFFGAVLLFFAAKIFKTAIVG